MNPHARLESLLARYLERREAGSDRPDPAELCRDVPDLLEPLRELIREYVDQLEELFTQNGEETQRRCAELLGRLPLEADVHVVVGLRDDFLLACNRFDALAPIFTERTPLHALPYEELLAKLRSLTNLRVVADSASPTGYAIRAGPFEGWHDVPSWLALEQPVTAGDGPAFTP